MINTIVWNIVYILLGYCFIYKIPPILSLKKQYSTILKIIGILTIIFGVFNIVEEILK